ncbi:6-phosphogluconolactonase [Streptomyces sp. AC495_CC817]|uniref:6-phosphogluconolactonase n=1 Tax=Streptomyces sp. AC495_CC817 TaxID=2823900 RepID=UPI001C27913D|nr:6-phosphogluconolactonase [Streptomyces sp. AC495_CC817]
MTLHPLTVHRHSDPAALGRAAGDRAAALIADAIASRGEARVMLAAAPSQSATLDRIASADLDFSRVTFFHMDDYLGLAADAPQGFGNWLEAGFLSRLSGEPTFHRIDPSLPAAESAASYAEAMGEEPFDVTLCGLGVNGHLAFNDPPADFSDPLAARPVTLDDTSRRQQVDEGHFPDVETVPAQAITVTIPRLLNARHVICSVPGAPKRQAVIDTLEHEPDPRFPGTALHTHPDVHLYVDAGSAPEGGGDV